MISGTMRAAVFKGPGEVRVETVEIPEPRAGEVRIRLEGSGVCASNLAHWQGMPWSQFPMEAGAMGHEGWGVVDAVAPDVTSFRPGDRVTGLSYHAYAEYDLARAEHLVRVPASFGSAPVPGESLGCAFNIFRRSDIREGQVVAVVGAGFLGAILVRLAAAAGARVIAISRRPFALEVARKMGAWHVIALEDHYRIIDQVRGLTGGLFCDRVIEAVGKQWPLDLAAELTRERGKLIIAGYHQDGPRQVNLQLWNWRGLDVINAHERDPQAYLEGIRAAIDAIQTGVLDPSSFYTHRYPLEKIGTALDETRDRPEGFLKALVMMS